MTSLVTNVPIFSYFFKPINEVDPIEEKLESLREYFYNFQSKFFVRRSKKRNHDSIETS